MEREQNRPMWIIRVFIRYTINLICQVNGYIFRRYGLNIPACIKFWNGMGAWPHLHTIIPWKDDRKKNNNIRMENGIKEIIPNVKHSTLWIFIQAASNATSDWFA